MLEQLLPPNQPAHSVEEAINRETDWHQLGLVTRCAGEAACQDVDNEPDWYSLVGDPENEGNEYDTEGIIFPVSPNLLDQMSTPN